MIWIGAATLVAFVLIRGLPQLGPSFRPRPRAIRLNPASIVITDDITVRPA